MIIIIINYKYFYMEFTNIFIINKNFDIKYYFSIIIFFRKKLIIYYE